MARRSGPGTTRTWGGRRPTGTLSEFHTVFHTEPPPEGRCSAKCLKRMAGVTRLELATSGVTGQRSNQTELHPRKERAEIYAHGNPESSRADRAETGRPVYRLKLVRANRSGPKIGAVARRSGAVGVGLREVIIRTRTTGCPTGGQPDGQQRHHHQTTNSRHRSASLSFLGADRSSN